MLLLLLFIYAFKFQKRLIIKEHILLTGLLFQ